MSNQLISSCSNVNLSLSTHVAYLSFDDHMSISISVVGLSVLTEYPPNLEQFESKSVVKYIQDMSFV